MRKQDVTALTAAELEAARRELAASLALAKPGSPVRAPIQARMAAIDAELARRAAARPGLAGSPRARPPDGGHTGGERRPAPPSGAGASSRPGQPEQDHLPPRSRRAQGASTRHHSDRNHGQHIIH